MAGLKSKQSVIVQTNLWYAYGFSAGETLLSIYMSNLQVMSREQWMLFLCFYKFL